MSGRTLARRGLTLLEILIALALFITLAALAMPNLMATLDERRFDSALDDVHSQLLMARAYAQRTGVPVEVVFLSNPPHVVARSFEPGARSIDVGEYRDATGDDRPGFEDADDGSGALDLDYDRLDEPDHINENWAMLELHEPIRLTDRREEVEDLASAVLGDREPWDETFDDADRFETSRPVRIAVYLPDGSTLLTRDVWVIDEINDQFGSITVNPWTGLPEAKRINPRELAEESPDDEPDEADAEDEGSGEDDLFDDGRDERTSNRPIERDATDSDLDSSDDEAADSDDGSEK